MSERLARTEESYSACISSRWRRLHAVIWIEIDGSTRRRASTGVTCAWKGERPRRTGQLVGERLVNRSEVRYRLVSALGRSGDSGD